MPSNVPVRVASGAIGTAITGFFGGLAWLFGDMVGPFLTTLAAILVAGSGVAFWPASPRRSSSWWR